MGNKPQEARPMRVEFGVINLRMAPGGPSQRVTLNYDAVQVQAVVQQLAQRAATQGIGR